MLQTTSGDLKVSIVSRPYWAWGLFTTGYLNIIDWKVLSQETHPTRPRPDQFTGAISLGDSSSALSPTMVAPPPSRYQSERK